MKIYVASSWRNQLQPSIVQALRAEKHLVYDFRYPKIGIKGFGWSQVDPDWQAWSMATYREKLNDPIAVAGFNCDWTAMLWAEVGVLVMPCGRSAHLEAGYFVGAGKPLYILLSEGEPELMYRMATKLCVSLEELLECLK